MQKEINWHLLHSVVKYFFKFSWCVIYMRLIVNEVKWRNLLMGVLIFFHFSPHHLEEKVPHWSRKKSKLMEYNKLAWISPSFNMVFSYGRCEVAVEKFHVSIITLTRRQKFFSASREIKFRDSYRRFTFYNACDRLLFSLHGYHHRTAHSTLILDSFPPATFL